MILQRGGGIGLRTAFRPGATIYKRSITSIVDWKPIKSKKSTDEGSRIGRGIFMGLLVLMPVVSFGLGTWQVKRLKWKTDLITKSEYRLNLPPMPLPPTVNPAIVDSGEFDYRRVEVTGKFRHDQEMLVGPRMQDNREGYYVVTPLERKDGSKLLIFRGWIPKELGDKNKRKAVGALPEKEVTLVCQLQRKPKKNMFTPEDKPKEGLYHFMSIDEMAKQTDAQPVYIKALFDPIVDGRELLPEQMMSRGIPVGAPGKVEIRNTHFQYILTWYGLSALTTVMLFRLIKSRNAPKSFRAKKIAHAKQLDK